jgi:hypothetical protein
MIEIINMSDNNNDNHNSLVKRERPNKLKQIGQPENKKLYIEDYVYTYLYQITAANEEKEVMAILLGNIENDDEETNVYAEGAIEIKYHLVDQNGITFTEETWSDIYENIKKYFDGKRIVGWFISRPGYSAALNEIIYKAHSNNFSGMGQALLIVDKIEKEEVYYSYENGNLKQQAGYYIYYERNDAMQDYMIETRVTKNPEFEEYERVIDSYRKIETTKKEEHYQKKIVGLLYATSTALAVVVLVIGIVMLNNYDKMKQMEKAMDVINNNITSQSNPDSSEVFNPNDNEDDEDDIDADNSDPTGNKGDSTDDPNEDEPDVITTTTVKQEEPVVTTPTVEEPVVTTPTVEEPVVTPTKEPEPIEVVKPVYKEYRVKNGDTLVSILMAYYNNINNLEKVEEINNITNRDIIYEGEIILLP